MSLRRAEQISEVIARELNNYLIKELETPKNILITITRVVTSDDLKHSVIYLSILPLNKTASALRFFTANLGGMRRHISSKIKLFHAPDFKVVVDDSALKTRIIDREIEKIKNQE